MSQNAARGHEIASLLTVAVDEEPWGSVRSYFPGLAQRSRSNVLDCETFSSICIVNISKSIAVLEIPLCKEPQSFTGIVCTKPDRRAVATSSLLEMVERLDVLIVCVMSSYVLVRQLHFSRLWWPVVGTGRPLRPKWACGHDVPGNKV